MSIPYAAYSATTAQQTQYPNHYPNVPVQIQPTSTYYSPYNAPGTTATGAPSLASLSIQPDTYRQTNPAPARPPSPPEPSITPDVATRAIRRLVENEAIKVGFAYSDAQAVRRLELETVAFVEQLFERAHEYANLANRASAIPSDLLLAIADFGIEHKELYRLARKRRSSQAAAAAAAGTTESTDMVVSPKMKPKKLSRAKPKISPMQLTSSTSRSPSPDLLPSDDESGPPIMPVSLRGLPPYLPQLPPKHTYLQTPASPPKKAALPSLEKKLKTAGLVQESLKNLMLATEDSTGQEDAELLGHIVNWEMGLHPRKRWRIGN